MEMKNEYIIISKTAIQKRIEELEKEYNQEPEEHMKDWFLGQIEALKQIISKSTNLMPEIEKAFLAGRSVENIDSIDDIKPTYIKSEDYISNLKINLWT